MNGRGVEMLRELLASIRAQSYTDYEIVVSDADPSRDMVAMLASFGLTHVSGKEGAAANLNNAIDHARGNIIKPMFQDDKFIEPDSLQKIADAFVPAMDSVYVIRADSDHSYEPVPQWVACTSRNAGLENYDHGPYPHKSLERLREGENTYGSPSAMAWIKNDLRFDEKLHWLFDCEFYARMAKRYGVPKFVDTPIYIRQWEGMASRTSATGHQRILDGNYVIEKYR